MDYRETNALALIALFARSGAVIGQPAVQNSIWYSVLCRLLNFGKVLSTSRSHLTYVEDRRSSQCSVRFTPVVEVSVQQIVWLPGNK